MSRKTPRNLPVLTSPQQVLENAVFGPDYPEMPADMTPWTPEDMQDFTYHMFHADKIREVAKQAGLAAAAEAGVTIPTKPVANREFKHGKIYRVKEALWNNPNLTVKQLQAMLPDVGPNVIGAVRIDWVHTMKCLQELAGPDFAKLQPKH